jgi:hypothetical protein
MRVFEKCQGVCKSGRGGENGGKIKWKLSEVDTKAVPRERIN